MLLTSSHLMLCKTSGLKTFIIIRGIILNSSFYRHPIFYYWQKILILYPWIVTSGLKALSIIYFWQKIPYFTSKKTTSCKRKTKLEPCLLLRCLDLGVRFGLVVKLEWCDNVNRLLKVECKEGEQKQRMAEEKLVLRLCELVHFPYH